jgi:hypothetical protein
LSAAGFIGYRNILLTARQGETPVGGRGSIGALE